MSSNPVLTPIEYVDPDLQRLHDRLDADFTRIAGVLDAALGAKKRLHKAKSPVMAQRRAAHDALRTAARAAIEALALATDDNVGSSRSDHDRQTGKCGS